MTKKKINCTVWKARKLLVVTLMLLMTFGCFSNVFGSVAYAASPSVVYQSHVSTIGWQGDVKNGATSGTEGRSLAIECVTIEIKNTGYSGGIRYRVHMAGKGWSNWIYDDRPCGTTGEGRQTEAIQIELYGEVAKYFKVEYRTHCQNVGWSSWRSSGISGTTGQGLRMEAFQVRLVKTSSSNSSSSNKTATTLNFSTLQKTYPDNSKWNSSFMNKAWQCQGFACTLGYSLSGKDPYNWKKAYSLDKVKPGDIIRFNRPHSIMVTAVNGNEITYVDCNWVSKNTVKWNQKIQKNKMTGKWGSLNYVMQYPN